MLKNDSNHYGSVSKGLHLTIALIFICQYVFVYWADALPKNDTMKGSLMWLHKSVGMTTLFIALFYVVWFISNIKPQLAPMHKILAILAKLMHFILFFCMLAMPLSGYIMAAAGGRAVSWFGVFDWPILLSINKPLAGNSHDFHVILADIILWLVAFHVLAALKHHFIDKDNTLTRMRPFGS